MTIVLRDVVRATFSDQVRRSVEREDALQATAEALCLAREVVNEVLAEAGDYDATRTLP